MPLFLIIYSMVLIDSFYHIIGGSSFSLLLFFMVLWYFWWFLFLLFFVFVLCRLLIVFISVSYFFYKILHLKYTFVRTFTKYFKCNSFFHKGLEGYAEIIHIYVWICMKSITICNGFCHFSYVWICIYVWFWERVGHLLFFEVPFQV